MPSGSAPPAHAASRLYWLCQLTGWGVYMVVNVFAGVLLMHVPVGRASLELLTLSALGLASTHLLRAYMRAHGWVRLPWRTRIGRLFFASALCGALIAGIKGLFELAPWQTGDIPIEPTALQWLQPILVFVVPLLNWMLLILIWCALYFGALAVRAHKSAQLRESELARALQLAELRLLKSQLNPHYLFNALNTVRALISIDPAAAQHAVTRLARTLRYTLGAAQEEQVSLDQELDTVEDYLALESLRLGERLKVERDVAPAARSVRIPVMLLQTLVENAIKHGIAELPAGGVLKIAARLESDIFTLTVENPCPSRASASGEGIGLRNAAERLRLLFGPSASVQLDLSRPPPDGSTPAAVAAALARVCIRQGP